jgi:hypothetical protein
MKRCLLFLVAAVAIGCEDYKLTSEPQLNTSPHTESGGVFTSETGVAIGDVSWRLISFADKDGGKTMIRGAYNSLWRNSTGTTKIVSPELGFYDANDFHIDTVGQKKFSIAPHDSTKIRSNFILRTLPSERPTPSLKWRYGHSSKMDSTKPFDNDFTPKALPSLSEGEEAGA